jgi:small subunit ribosomal protein S17
MQDIGIPVKAPKQECADKKCPFHGSLPVRKRTFVGTVVSDAMNNTVVIRRDYHHYVAKYLRYDRRHSHISAHSPPCMEAERGDKVMVAECRPLSKTVSFVVVEKLEKD